jgi:predicted nucleic acid-binding protein
MLNFNSKVLVLFLEWLKRDALTIMNLEKAHLSRIIELINKYSDLPMDLADSSLVVIGEMTGVNKIATIDSDYYVYKLKGNKTFENVFFS